MSEPRKSTRKTRIPGPERKKVILDKAIELFARRGFDGTSTDAIAAAAGITKPVLYDHFSSKEDLYIAVCTEIREQLLTIGREAAPTVSILTGRIRAGVEAFFKFADQNPAMISILLSPPRAHKKLYRAIQAIQDEATDSITKMMLAIGVPKPSDEAPAQELQIQVEFIKRGLHALGQWRTEHPSVSRDTIIEAIAALIESGLVRS